MSLGFRFEVHEVVAEVDHQLCALERGSGLVVPPLAYDVERRLVLAERATLDPALVLPQALERAPRFRVDRNARHAGRRAAWSRPGHVEDYLVHERL